MAKKKRLPIQQLREVAKEAEIILKRKGIHTQESSIERIRNDPTSPKLPGIPNYLPHRWTLAASRKVLGNLLILWVNKTKGDTQQHREDHQRFFKFIVEEMSKIEEKKKQEVSLQPALIKSLQGAVLLNKVFAPMQEMETTHSMTQFLIDSFAVAVVLKQHQTVSDYVFWFDEWTRELDRLWTRNEKPDGQ